MSFEIKTSKMLTITDVTVSGNVQVYDGTAKSLAISADGATASYSTVLEGPYSSTLPEYTDAGAYIVYYKLEKSGYHDYYNVAELQIKEKEIGIAWTNTAFIYDGTLKLPTATAKDVVTGDEISLTVEGAQINASETAYTATVTAITGEKAVNYKLPTNKTTQFTIGKATPEYSIPTGLTAIYSDTLADVTLPTGWTWKDAETSVGNVGENTFTAVYTQDSTGNYETVEADVTVTVSKLKVEKPAEDSTVYTYNGQNQTYDVAETANYTVSNGTQKNAGNYTVTVALKDKDNTVWADSGDTADKTFGFEIKKATITITAKNKSAYVNDIAPVLGESDYTVSGLATGESLKTLPTIAYASTPDMTKAGTVSITVSGAEAPDGGNYNEIVYNNGTLTISTKPSGGGGYYPTTYSITVEDAKNGDVSVSLITASQGSTVTITVSPEKGYTLETLTVTDKNGKEIELTNKGNGKYTFKMPGSKVTVKATFMDDNTMLNFFVDVPADAYYYDAVLWAVKEGITNGTSATTFSPDNPCTRAQMATFLWRAAGSPEPVSKVCIFTDVPADAYYVKAVQWAYEQGITAGTSATTYSPDKACTRSQMATFLCRMVDGKPVNDTIIFADIKADKYYAKAVQWAYEQKITAGTSTTTFSPDDPCTRAQMVTFLYRYFVK